jgi:hypothetical protein
VKGARVADVPVRLHPSGSLIAVQILRQMGLSFWKIGRQASLIVLFGRVVADAVIGETQCAGFL